MSEYFERKSATKEFVKYVNAVVEKLQGKRVILYGAGLNYFELQKKFDLKAKLNIVGISDKKFETQDIKEFDTIKAVKPEDIPNQEFDVILLTLEYTRPVIKYLESSLQISSDRVICLIQDEISDERESFLYLMNFNFEKNLEKLKNKMKNKKVVFYGACPFFKVASKYFDMSGFNCIGIADRKYQAEKTESTFLGYKTFSPEEIPDLKPDFVIVTTKFYVNIVEDLYYKILRNTNIKIKPLVKKPFFVLLKEIIK